MPEIQAFRAVRYNLGHVGSLGDVVAPPYDVIGPELQEKLYQKHPNNVVRLILNRQEITDDEQNNRYVRAKRLLKEWQSQGVLFTEADPAIYVYQQEFTSEGRTHIRRGFMARMRLSRFGEGQVFPHEETLSGPKVDRLMLTAVCKANLSQVFGLYPDPAGEVQEPLEDLLGRLTPLEAVDHLGVIHRMWPVTDVGVIATVAARIGSKPLFIADGHHRYETACNYRQQVYDSGALRPDHPANFVLMQFIAMEDAGLLVLATHRLFRGIPELSGEELAARLSPFFTARPAGQGPEQATAVWEDIATSADKAAIGLYAAKDGRWLVAQLTDAGRAKMAEVAADHGPEWHSLGVSILHRLVVLLVAGKIEIPKPDYVHLVDEVISGLKTGQYPLAALVMPATVDDIRNVSMQGERLPAKSTYFYPKLLSGLVINPLE